MNKSVFCRDCLLKDTTRCTEIEPGDQDIEILDCDYRKKRKGDDMNKKQMPIDVSEKDFNTIRHIGWKPWGQVSEEEKKEYDRLVNFYGTKLAMQILMRKSEA